MRGEESNRQKVGGGIEEREEAKVGWEECDQAGHLGREEGTDYPRDCGRVVQAGRDNSSDKK